MRSLTAEVELRKANDGVESRTIEGYAVKWEQLSETMGCFYKFREKIAKNAFSESLNNDNQRALWNHNTDYVLGNTKSGTLRLFEDDVGLRFEVDLPNNTWGNDVLESVRRMDVNGVSFGFQLKGEEWDDSNDIVIRTILKANLFEISPCAFPAYPQSEVSARSIEDDYATFKKAKFDSEKSIYINNQRELFTNLRKKILLGGFK